ncbi:MAG: Hsp20/alpha crystallin family protein [Chthoniobacterales bacterium]|jgi:HSP20 family protein|nr:Hsp20/alpha crystallin family protein [Chthoniobacterales bacterium]
MINNQMRENNGAATARRESEKFITPIASVKETPDGYTLELEMPGVSKDGLEISVENNELSIIGRRNTSAPERTLVHRESSSHNYRRSFEIDPSIESGKIGARMSQGVVTLTLPKAEEVKPRKITVG